MELIDSHAHLDLRDYKDDRADVIARALEAGVSHIIAIGLGVDGTKSAIALAEENEFISATAGFHPHDAKSLDREKLVEILELAQSDRVVGFGEIGLDFYRDLSPRPVQMQAFGDLINIGLDLKLPLIIHDRDAHHEVFTRINNVRSRLSGGVIHCFSGDYDLAKRYIDLGFYISIPGTITYKKADGLREVVAKIPLDSIILETDCPFLAPVPKRGRRNEPALIVHTAKEVARVKNITAEETAKATTANTRRLFGV